MTAEIRDLMLGKLKMTSANDLAQATFSSMVAFTMECILETHSYAVWTSATLYFW